MQGRVALHGSWNWRQSSLPAPLPTPECPPGLPENVAMPASSWRWPSGHPVLVVLAYCQCWMFLMELFVTELILPALSLLASALNLLLVMWQPTDN